MAASKSIKTPPRGFTEKFLENDGKLPIPDRQALYRREQRQYCLIGGAAGIIAGALLVGLGAEPAWAGWLVGALGLVSLWFGRPRPPLNRTRR